MKQKTIGVLNKGKNNQFINNKFHNLDIGILDEGEGTIASGNKFFRKIKEVGFWKKYFWIPLLVVILGGFILHWFGWT